MIGFERLAEQHIREHQCRQLKLDEIDALESASRGGRAADASASSTNWRLANISRAGPMGIWDVVAQDLESCVEFFEHAPKCELTRGTGHPGTLHCL
jgi:hypothetical protein